MGSDQKNSPLTPEERIAGRKGKLKETGRLIGCVSNTCGAVFISDELTFIDRTYKLPDGERIFTVRRTAKALNLLSGEQFRKVFEFEYRHAVQTSLANNTALCLSEIAMGSGLTEDETESALEEMLQLGLIEVYESNEGDPRYVFCSVKDFMYLRSIRLPDL